MKRTNTKSVTEATTKTTPAKTEKVTEKATKTTKKAATKKGAVKKEVAETVFVQYAGQEYDINEITDFNSLYDALKTIKEAVKKAWTEETDKKESDITEIQIYVKPEEAAAYYVVNGEVAEGGNKILL